MKRYRHHKGFTLAEVLISLALLGVVAAFVVPKVLTTVQHERNLAVAKDTIAMVSSAYQRYQLDHGPPPETFRLRDLLPYLNYLAEDTTSIVDWTNTQTFRDCAISYCIRLHNGAVLYNLHPNSSSHGPWFNGQTPLNAIYFDIDPDGVYGGSTTGPSKSLSVWLYYDGSFRTRGSVKTGTSNSFGDNQIAIPERDPEWFHW